MESEPFFKGTVMRKIELRGEVLPGYAPGLPDTCGDMAKGCVLF